MQQTFQYEFFPMSVRDFFAQKNALIHVHINDLRSTAIGRDGTRGANFLRLEHIGVEHIGECAACLDDLRDPARIERNDGDLFGRLRRNLSTTFTFQIAPAVPDR